MVVQAARNVVLVVGRAARETPAQEEHFASRSEPPAINPDFLGRIRARSV